MTVPGMRQEAAALATKVAGAAVPLLKPGGILFPYDCASFVNTLWLTADGHCVCMAGMQGLLSATLGDCVMSLCVLLRAGSEEAQGRLGMAAECLIAAMSAAPAVFRAHLKPLEDYAVSALMGQSSSTSARQSASHLLSLLPSVTGTQGPSLHAQLLKLLEGALLLPQVVHYLEQKGGFNETEGLL